MKKEKFSMELRIGLFVIIVILLAMILITTQATTSRYKGYEIGILFDYVGGLETGSPVRVSGVRAGEVKQIEILYETQPKVLATAKIRQGIKISTDSRITIQALGLIGEKFIEITPSPVKTYIQPGEIIEGENPLSMEKLVEAGQNMIVGFNNILSDINKITGDKELQDNLKTVIADSATAVKRIDATFAGIEILATNLSESSKRFNETLAVATPELEKLLKNTNELVVSGKTRMEATMDEIQQFAAAGTKAAESFEDIQKAAISFDKMSTDMQDFLWQIQNEGFFAQLMQEKEMVGQLKHGLRLFTSATTQLTESSERINELTFNLNKIVADVEKGKGTTGKLLRDDELYNNLNDFVKDIKAHPWKLLIRR